MKFMPAIAAEAMGSQPTLESLDPSLEGFKDILKAPIAALKAKFTETDGAKLHRELEEKFAVLKAERHNLEKIRASLSASKDNGPHVISLKKIQGKYHFSASTPDQLSAGLSATAKFMEGIAREASQLKNKVEGEKLKDRVEAEFAKKGRIAESMSFNRSQALAYVNQSQRVIDALEKYLEALQSHAKLNISNEGLGEGIVLVFKIVFSFLFIIVWSRLVAYGIVLIAGVVFVVNPFLGVVVGLGLFGLAMHASMKLGTALGEWIAGDGEQAEHLTAKKH